MLECIVCYKKSEFWKASNYSFYSNSGAFSIFHDRFGSGKYYSNCRYIWFSIFTGLFYNLGDSYGIKGKQLN